MGSRNKILAAVLILAAALSIGLPADTLFLGDGRLVSALKNTDSIKMMAEIVLLLFLSGGIFFLIRDWRRKVIAAALLAVGFCWLHVVFLPMVVSALYLGFLILAGRFLRERIFKIEDRCGYPIDFLLGSSAVITFFCLLSAAGVGRIPIMRYSCLAAGLILYVIYGRKAVADKRADTLWERIGNTPESRFYSAGFAFIFVMVLIQAGRMNLALDFDTLWYGVRSEYILAAGNGIYENPGMVGMVYVYSKGLEVLTLPLADLASHSYLLFFTLWLAVLGLTMVYRIARLFMNGKYAFLAAVLCASLPGIMNMGISAKPDVITWLLQLIMVEYFFRYVQSTKQEGIKEDRSEKRQVSLLILAAGAYLLSLTMKPTSLVFSTAVFGMMGLYLIFSRRLCFRASVRHWASLLLPGAALIGIWARTMMITGMPVTSVFTSIFAKLGFEMKYPFATGSLPQNWQEESNLHVLLRRLFQMLLAPEGKDMGHVIIAWGTSLLFFLIICILVSILAGRRNREKGEPLTTAAIVIFWPFLAVNLISLIMLYQVDGNYFMLLYTFLILLACRQIAQMREEGLRRLTCFLLIPLLGFNILVTAQTNWAGAVGFSKIQVLNKGRFNHKAKQYDDMAGRGNAAFWHILAADPKNRVIAFGDHPRCLEFPCNVQSYKDITAPWGNVELVNTPEAFEEYMEYAKTDYVYAEAGHMGTDSWEWSYGLLRELIARGVLTDFSFENGNVLARVADERISKEEAARNLIRFDENYITSDMIKQEAQKNG